MTTTRHRRNALELAAVPGPAADPPRACTGTVNDRHARRVHLLAPPPTSPCSWTLDISLSCALADNQPWTSSSLRKLGARSPSEVAGHVAALVAVCVRSSGAAWCGARSGRWITGTLPRTAFASARARSAFGLAPRSGARRGRASRHAADTLNLSWFSDRGSLLWLALGLVGFVWSSSRSALGVRGGTLRDAGTRSAARRAWAVRALATAGGPGVGLGLGLTVSWRVARP
jgi:hypothetical protein